VPRPRSFDQIADPAFLATRKHIEHLIHPPGNEAKESFPVLKFSAPDPDVV
jgi:NitT/TauT family transport system ATP-binding protein